MIKSYGYCEICSTDVLNFVASIFAGGDAKIRRGRRGMMELLKRPPPDLAEPES